MDDSPNTKMLQASASRVLRRPPPPQLNSRKGLNWSYALLSLIIGTLMWFGVDMKRMEEMTLEIAINFKSKLPGDWKFVVPPNPTVKATLRGTRQDIATIRNKEGIQLIPDFPPGAFDGDLYDGILTFQVDQVSGLPPGIEVRMVEPQTTPIHLSKTITRYITVEAGPIVGTPQEGYIVSNVHKIDPPAVPVTASREFLSKLGPTDVILTREFSVEGGRGPVGGQVGLQPLKKDDEEVEVPGSVYMTVELVETPVDREFAEPFEVRALLDSPFDRYAGLNISPPSVRVAVTGPKSVIDKLSAGEIIIYADIRDRVPAAAGEFNLRCRAITPANVRVTRIEPDTVKWLTREQQAPEPSLLP